MPEFRRAIVIEPFMPGVPNSSIQFEKGCERPSTKSALFTSGSGSLSLAKLIQIDFFDLLYLSDRKPWLSYEEPNSLIKD